MKRFVSSLLCVFLVLSGTTKVASQGLFINTIADVPTTNPHYTAIHYSVFNDLMSLDDTGLFNPNKPVSSEEFLMTLLALKELVKHSDMFVKDTDNIISMHQDTFTANMPLTRAKLAHFLYTFIKDTLQRHYSIDISNPTILHNDTELLKGDATVNYLYTMLGLYSAYRQPLTKLDLANILIKDISISYNNYEYYRSNIKDTANINVLKCYSEGILDINENGLFEPTKILSRAEVKDYIERLNSPVKPTRPTYSQHNRIPVLMYHEINSLPEKGPTGLYVSRESFSQQLDALVQNGYNTITMTQLNNHFRYDYPLPEKPIVLTFDDGYKSHYEYAGPELAKRGMCGTFYIITDLLYEDPVQCSLDLNDLYDIGMEIGSHSCSHLDIFRSGLKKIRNELIESKKILEALLGTEIKHFCYPYGHETNYSIKVLKESGYDTAVKTTYGHVTKKDDIYKLKRIRVDYKDDVEKFLNRLK